MSKLIRCCVIALLGLSAVGELTADDTTATTPVSFARDIASIFQARCVACHNTKTSEGRLNMLTYAALMNGGESGAIIDPGDGEFSTLCALIEDGSMPKEADPLTPEQIDLIKRWVEQGATLDEGVDPSESLIRIMPRPSQPAAPETYTVTLPVTALAFSPDGSRLATSGYHEVLLWDTSDGTLVQRIGDMAERIYDIDFHPDGHRLALAAGTPGQRGEVRLIDTTDGSLLRHLTTTGDVMLAATFSPDGTRIAACGADRAIRLFNVDTGAEETVIADHADWVMSVDWSPDGTKLASASRDKTAKLFDAATGDALLTFNGHADTVYAVGFFPDGQHVATVGADDRIRTWTLEKAKQKQEIKSHVDDVFGLHILTDGQAVSAGADKTARLHTLDDGKEVRSFTGHDEWVTAIAVHEGSKRIATGSYDGEVRLWNLDTGDVVLVFRAAPGREEVVTKEISTKTEK